MEYRAVIAEDIATLEQWHREHRIECSGLEKLLPKIGLIVPGVAAAFLYSTDSPLGIIDGLIANPFAPSNERSDAVKMLLNGLVDEAKKLGKRRVIATTKIPKVGNYGIETGWSFMGNCMMFQKEITQ